MNGDRGTRRTGVDYVSPATVDVFIYFSYENERMSRGQGNKGGSFWMSKSSSIGVIPQTFSSIPALYAFDPRTTTWQSYRDRITFFFKANRINTDDDKKALFLWSVGDATYSLLESLVSPKLLTDDDTQFIDLVTILDSHYDATKNIMTATYDFYSCYQKPGQTFAEWKAELCEKLRYCGFTTSVLKNKPQDRALRDMYVIGINNPKIRQALLKEQDPDLEKTEKIIQVAERLEEDVRHFGTSINHTDSTIAKVQPKRFNQRPATLNKPTPKRVEAIQNLPTPRNVKEIEAFIGKVNYYGKFVSNFSDLCEPLNRLRRKNAAWKWTPACDTPSANLKQQLAEATTLVHFDAQLPLILATDASNYGIGAVIMHRYPDESEKPIAHASKTLTAAEKNYSQIEKEALSIVYGVKKFHQYLAGHTFELVTDHQPLLSIFSPVKGIPVATANRLQRWAICLMGYSYHIRYKPTRLHANADALSRLPAGPDDSFVDNESLQINRIHAQIIEEGPVDAAEVQAAMDKDETLQMVKKFTLVKWPNSFSKKNNPELIAYYDNRHALSVVNGCLLKDVQVIIPKQLQRRVLHMLHRAHLGVVKMKQLARLHCWWPKIDKDIASLANSCEICARSAAMPKEEFKPWSEPEHVWSRAHMDFAGPLWGSKWLVIVDAKSKFPFVADMGNNTTAKSLCNVLEQAIDWLGPPETLVSDNGPPFSSYEMKDFYKKYGIEHVTTAPYHPASNGLAERFVRSFKEGMMKEQQAGQTNKN
ncbi:unnamed protein product, partial [Didymodactylos carnosus]